MLSIFPYLLAFCRLLFKHCLFISPFINWTALFFVIQEHFVVLYAFQVPIHCHMYTGKAFLPSCRLSFRLTNCFICCSETFNFLQFLVDSWTQGMLNSFFLFKTCIYFSMLFPYNHIVGTANYQPLLMSPTITITTLHSGLWRVWQMP